MSNSPLHTSPSKEKLILKSTSKIELECEECGNPISGKNININSSLAQCDNCNTVFKLEDDLFFLNDRKGRPEMIMPEGTDVLELSETLDIRLDRLKSQPRGAIGFLTFFTVIWNGFLAIMGAGMIATGAFSALIFLSIHLLVGLGLIFYLARVYLNYTDIIINNFQIQIAERPIKSPFSPTITIPLSNVEQLFVIKYVASRTNNKPNYAYALNLLTKQGKKISLIKGMNKETMLYLEQKIERYLKIEDRAIENSITS